MNYIMPDPLAESNEWQKVTASGTERLKVDGGYIYKDEKGSGGLAMVFVPDVDLQRYQSHLRDAYTKGFQDGAFDALQASVDQDKVKMATI